jgi:hypothetical protein
MLLEFQGRNSRVKDTRVNATRMIYSCVINERQMYKKDPQSYDPLHYKRLTELGFQYSLNRKQNTFSEGLVFIADFSNNMGTVLFQHSIQKTSNLLTGPSTYAVKVINFSQQGQQKSSLKGPWN